MSLLEAKNLLRLRGGRAVLEVAELKFDPSSITAFCGPNGAGKSTLLSILGLVDYADRGEIIFGGRALSSHGDWFEARKRVTLVEQNPYALPGTVLDNAGYGLRMRGLDRSETLARAREALARVGLSGFEKRRARTLSGGEVQRMAIARAIALRPKVLALDEPTAHVDAARVSEVESLIRQAAADGAAVIFATHDHDQALRLSRRLFHMEDGKVAVAGPRVFDAELRRNGGVVIAAVQGAWPGPSECCISRLSRAGELIVLELEGCPLMLRAPREQAEAARVFPGQALRAVSG